MSQEEDGDESEQERPGRNGVPPLPPALILAVVGLLSGFATVAGVWLSERGCERFRDTTNCGALGLPLLVLIVVVTMVLGGLALSRLAMPHPKLIPFLGVAFMVALVVAFLTGHLDSPWIIAAVPVLTAITFLLANLVARLLERADA
ncbi:hypothetical protein ACXJJ3_19890 [Kribbella sp. WER1]